MIKLSEEYLFSYFVNLYLYDVTKFTDTIRNTLNQQLHIALVGNPNSGKSSLFNSLTEGGKFSGSYG